jgi:hypothetical protein
MDYIIYGLIAAIAFILGTLTMDRMWAHRLGIIRKKFTQSAIETRGSGLGVPLPQLSSDPELEDWSVLATGKSGWLEIEQAWLRKVQEIYGIFCKKQADYGPTNIGVGGEQGVTLRTGDKISRMFELLGLTNRDVDGTPENESIRDTWADLADYGIIGMIVHDGDWPLVDPTQVWGREAMVKLLTDQMLESEEMRDLILTRVTELAIASEFAGDIGGEIINE